jgi:UrcA family protein
MNSVTQTTLRATGFFLCGAISLWGLQATAGAPETSFHQQRVSFADLDISKPAGAKVLYGRIKAAAYKVCSFEGDMSSIQRVNKCIDTAIDNAVRDVDSPALSALRPGSPIRLASQ